MPTVDGKKFAYTPEGLRAAAEARRGAKPMGSPAATKSGMMRKGYNFTKNLGERDLPDIGY